MRLKRYLRPTMTSEQVEAVTELVAWSNRQRNLKIMWALLYVFFFWALPGSFGFYSTGIETGWFGAFLCVVNTHMTVLLLAFMSAFCSMLEG